MNNKWIIFALIIIVSVIPYFNTLSNEFVYDDVDYFLNWQGIRNIDIVSYFSGDAPMYYEHVYRPVRSIIQSIVYQFSGVNPFGYHLFAIIINLLNVALVYLIAKKILNENRIAGLISVVIFALLPVHTMSVSFITASFNTAGIIFLFLSLYLYILFRELAKKKYIYGSMILGLVAFFTYELTLILPLLIILYDLCFKKITKDKIKYYVFYFSGALLLLIIRFNVLKNIYIDINPEYSLSYVNLGEVYIDQEQFEQAIKCFEKAISLRSNYAGSYYNLGLCYHSLGQEENAEENYKKAIEIYSKYFQSIKNLGVLYLGQERFDEAIIKFKQAIEIQKDDYELYFGLGLCYMNKEEKTISQEYFEKTLEINSDFSPAMEYIN
ncbi:MAG: tetratricopeptide repeat protein [bacterium]